MAGRRLGVATLVAKEPFRTARKRCALSSPGTSPGFRFQWDIARVLGLIPMRSPPPSQCLLCTSGFHWRVLLTDHSGATAADSHRFPVGWASLTCVMGTQRLPTEVAIPRSSG